MQVQSTSSATTAQTKQAPSKKIKRESILSDLKSDIVSIKDKKTENKVAIGLLTLVSAIAGFNSAKSGLFKTINTIVMAAVGFVASISLTKAADKDAKNKTEKTADDKNKPASASETAKPEVKQDTKAQDKPEIKTEEKAETKPENEENKEKGDDKDDD